MAKPSKKHALQKAVINTPNLGAMAAVFLSYSLGSILGTFVFIIAVIFGSYNKYNAVLHKKNIENKSSIFKFLNAPSLTAEILMAAAFINFIKTGYNGLHAPEEEILYYMTLSTAWFLGFWGDNTLRLNDKTNFSLKSAPKEKRPWIKAFIYILRNPVFYYTLCNMFLSMAILFASNTADSINHNTTLSYLNILVITTACIGVLYSFYKSVQVIKNKITAEQSNNGVINYILIAINIELAAMSFIEGLHWVIVAQIFYIISNITCLFETRQALKKEYA